MTMTIIHCKAYNYSSLVQIQSHYSILTTTPELPRPSHTNEILSTLLHTPLALASISPYPNNEISPYPNNEFSI